MAYFKKGTSFKESDGFADLRMMRPIVIVNKKNNSSHLLQSTEEIKICKKDITFIKPNIVSLFLSISKKEMEYAKKIYYDNIKQKLGTSQKVEFEENENKILFDYFEKIQISIIAVYSAVEAFANIAIPNNYKFHKKNNKNITEVWDKENIERWISTTEKINEILPSIMSVESPKKMKCWNNFKLLEKIRNDIIHPKTSSDERNVDMFFLGKLLEEKIFKIIWSGFNVIEYFCEKDELHPFFPMGFTELLLQKIELDNLEEYFNTTQD